MGNSPSSMTKCVKRGREQNCDCDDEDDNKKTKVVSGPLLLVDIKDVCQERIFELLGLEDLVNVAEADDRLIKAAVEVFSRCHRDKKMEVIVSSTSNIRPNYFQLRHDIAVACIRHFGHLMTTLSINFYSQGLHAPREIDIEEVISKHCTNSLVNLDVGFGSLNDFETMCKPFAMVENLAIFGCCLGPKLSQISIWFPNLVSLTLRRVEFFGLEFIEMKLTQLKTLVIYDEDGEMTQQIILEMLRFNPQLESLSLHCDYDIHFLRSISRYLPQLEKLELWPPKDRFQSFDNQTVSFEMVTTLTLNALPGTDAVVNMPLVFPNLQRLKLYGFDQFNRLILDFINRCEHVSKVLLIPLASRYSKVHVSDFRTALETRPLLTELEFCAEQFEEDEIVNFLSECKCLKRAQLLFMQLPSWLNLSVFEADWNLSGERILMSLDERASEANEGNLFMYLYRLNLIRKN